MASRRARSFELRALEALRERGWEILFHDSEILGVQVDLLARDPEGLLHVIEVKGQSPLGLARLSYAQRGRLLRVCLFLAGFEPCELSLVLVEDQKVGLVPVDALTVR